MKASTMGAFYLVHEGTTKSIITGCELKLLI